MRCSGISTGRIPEWPNGADCKSAGLYLRWFESIFAHNPNPTQPTQPSSGIATPIAMPLTFFFGGGWGL